jgi:hypothetical protein
MAIIEEAIRLEADNTISFGDYEAVEKRKVEDFKVGEDLYKVRTHKDVTRLSKNTKLLLETVPGAAVHNLNVSEKVTTFTVEGKGSTLITLELNPDTHYRVVVDDIMLESIKTNMTGKVGFSAELSEKPIEVKIEKIIGE